MAKFTEPQEFLDKLDWEGHAGVEWFNPDEFEDDDLAQAVEESIAAWTEFNGALTRATKRALELTNAEG